MSRWNAKHHPGILSQWNTCELFEEKKRYLYSKVGRSPGEDEFHTTYEYRSANSEGNGISQIETGDQFL